MFETKAIGMDSYQAPDRQDLTLLTSALPMALLSSQWSITHWTRASKARYDVKIGPGEDTYSLGGYHEPTLDKPMHTTHHVRKCIYLIRDSSLDTKGLRSNANNKKKWDLAWNRPRCCDLSGIFDQWASKSHTYFVMSRLQFCTSCKSLNWSKQSPYTVVLSTSPLGSS